LPCLRIKHFVPAFLRALSVVLYHTGLFSADDSAEKAPDRGGDALEGSCLQLPSARSPYAQFPRSQLPGRRSTTPRCHGEFFSNTG
jgi:hypothetical protein